MLTALRHAWLRARIQWLEYRQHSAVGDLNGYADTICILQAQIKLHNAAIRAWDEEIMRLQAQVPPQPLPQVYGDTVL